MGRESNGHSDEVRGAARHLPARTPAHTVAAMPFCAFLCLSVRVHSLAPDAASFSLCSRRHSRRSDEQNPRRLQVYMLWGHNGWIGGLLTG